MRKLSSNKVYGFEDFRLDSDQMMLYRGEEEIPLPPKAIETLLVLVERQGEILRKDELMQAIWANAAVEESNLAKYLHILRKTLGETRDGKPFIETFRRRGYRFNAEVRLLEISPAENGFAPQIVQTLGAPQFSVQSGNVLKSVDWRETENPATKIASDAAAASVLVPPKHISIGKAAIIAAALAVILFGSFFYARNKFLPSAEVAAKPKGELTFLRLTNGIAPHYATISPDGKYIAYSERDGETWRFFLQQTGQSNRLEIVSPSERVIADKTFSPDSQFIYFLGQDKGETQFSLYRIATLGGVQTKILDNLQSPVSFSPDGREMVFHRWNPQTTESALVIAASDGSTERILQSRAGGKEFLVYPAWSPDGATIAFGASYPPQEGGNWRINGINLQTGKIQALSTEKWSACFRIAWTRDASGLVFLGTKVGEELSTRRDNVFYLSIRTGEARCLTVDGNRYQLSSLGVTNDDAVIAVPDSRLSQIWQMSPDGDSRSAVQITHGLSDGRVGLAPLPDGRVGYISRTGENLNLWLMNADGTEQKQLTNDPPYIEELRVSPDGSYFVFLAKLNHRNQLFRIGADGANLQQLTFDGNQAGDSAISPDGNWIVYNSSVPDNGSYKHPLWKIPSAGGEPALFSQADCLAPHFSPDGKFLSCIRPEKEILILSAETGEVVKTFQTIQTSFLHTGAHWTRDGQNLVYKVERKRVSNLWLQPVSGGEPRQLTDFTAHGVWNFAFSSDGSRLYVVRVYQVNDAVLIKNFK